MFGVLNSPRHADRQGEGKENCEERAVLFEVRGHHEGHPGAGGLCVPGHDAHEPKPGCPPLPEHRRPFRFVDVHQAVVVQPLVRHGWGGWELGQVVSSRVGGVGGFPPGFPGEILKYPYDFLMKSDSFF